MKFLKLSLITLLCVLLIGCSSKTKSVNSDDNAENSPTITVTPEDTEATKDDQTKTTPEATEAPKSTAQTSTTAKSASTSLSNDIYSFQLQFGEDLYQFPMSYEEFTKFGWKLTDDDTETLSPEQYTIATFENKDGYTVYTEIFNLGKDTLPFNKCQIGGITVEEMINYEKEITCFLPGGIQFGVSSKEDIIAAYGDPTDIYDGEIYTQLTYSYDSYQTIEISLDGETKVINKIDIQNLVEEQETSNQEAVNTEVPEIVKKYQAPTSLGKDITKFIVEYDGALYKIPAPVSEFEKNGWKIKKESSDSLIASKDIGWISIMKNNQTLKAMVCNYADTETSINNCFLLSVKGDDSSTNVPITIQNGITRGMSQADLEKALKGTEYEKEDSSSLVFYVIEGADSSTNEVTIIVNKDSKTVQTIELNNQPDTENLFK